MTNINDVANVVLKRSKNDTRLTIFQLICFFIVIPSLIFAPVFYLEEKYGNLGLILLVAIPIFVALFWGYAQLVFFLTEKNLKDMFEEEKKLGTMIMFTPYLSRKKGDSYLNVLLDSSEKIKTSEDTYYLYFYPYANDKSTRVKFEITKELYEKYKDKVENYEYKFSKPNLVTIETATGLFDGKMEYTNSSNDFYF